MVGLCVCVLLGGLIGNGGLGCGFLPLCLSSFFSPIWVLWLSSFFSPIWVCDCDGGCFVIWKKKVVARPFFFFLSFFFFFFFHVVDFGCHSGG